MLTEIYLGRACSCHEILRTETAGQVGAVCERDAAARQRDLHSLPGRQVSRLALECATLQARIEPVAL
eukprot:COSAG01_NODE_2545_length_7469_cov_6.612890_6_plen_68_part_00